MKDLRLGKYLGTVSLVYIQNDVVKGINDTDSADKTSNINGVGFFSFASNRTGRRVSTLLFVRFYHTNTPVTKTDVVRRRWC